MRPKRSIAKEDAASPAAKNASASFMQNWIGQPKTPKPTLASPPSAVGSSSSESSASSSSSSPQSPAVLPITPTISPNTTTSDENHALATSITTPSTTAKTAAPTSESSSTLPSGNNHATLSHVLTPSTQTTEPSPAATTTNTTLSSSSLVTPSSPFSSLSESSPSTASAEGASSLAASDFFSFSSTDKTKEKRKRKKPAKDETESVTAAGAVPATVPTAAKKEKKEKKDKTAKTGEAGTPKVSKKEKKDKEATPSKEGTGPPKVEGAITPKVKAAKKVKVEVVPAVLSAAMAERKRCFEVDQAQLLTSEGLPEPVPVASHPEALNALAAFHAAALAPESLEDLPTEHLPLVGMLVHDSDAPLTVLAGSLVTQLFPEAGEHAATLAAKLAVCITTKVAERKSYGAKPQGLVKNEDTTLESHWRWNCITTDHLPKELHIEVAASRRILAKRSLHISAISSFLAMTQKAEVDETKLAAKGEQIDKHSRESTVLQDKETERRKKIQERKDKESDKAVIAEKKKEEKAAKDAELESKKRKREEEVEAKKEKDEETKKKKEALVKKKIVPSVMAFFVAKPPAKKPKPSSTEVAEQGPKSMFFGWEAPLDSRMAPILRLPLSPERAARLDQQMGSDTPVDALILQAARRRRVRGRAGTCSRQVKFLKFHVNYRPAFFGRSFAVSRRVCGRHPLREDPALDYDVDSDDEWERNEPEDGEDCSSDEDMDEEMDHDEMAGRLRQDGLVDDGWVMPEEDDNFEASKERRDDCEPTLFGPSWGADVCAGLREFVVLQLVKGVIEVVNPLFAPQPPPSPPPKPKKAPKVKEAKEVKAVDAPAKPKATRKARKPKVPAASDGILMQAKTNKAATKSKTTKKIAPTIVSANLKSPTTPFSFFASPPSLSLASSPAPSATPATSVLVATPAPTSSASVSILASPEPSNKPSSAAQSPAYISKSCEEGVMNTPQAHLLPSKAVVRQDITPEVATIPGSLSNKSKALFASLPEVPEASPSSEAVESVAAV